MWVNTSPVPSHAGPSDVPPYGPATSSNSQLTLSPLQSLWPALIVTSTRTVSIAWAPPNMLYRSTIPVREERSYGLVNHSRAGLTPEFVTEPTAKLSTRFVPDRGDWSEVVQRADCLLPAVALETIEQLSFPRLREELWGGVPSYETMNTPRFHGPCQELLTRVTQRSPQRGPRDTTSIGSRSGMVGFAGRAIHTWRRRPGETRRSCQERTRAGSRASLAGRGPRT